VTAAATAAAVNLILSVTGSEKSIKNLTELLYTVKI
jgi:hypothetical protein